MRIHLIALLAASSWALPAHAQEESPRHTQAILAYGKVGGLFPVSKLGPHVTFHLGAGYILPVLKSRLAVVADLGYSQASTSKGLDDPRIGGSPAEANFRMSPLPQTASPEQKVVMPSSIWSASSGNFPAKA